MTFPFGIPGSDPWKQRFGIDPNILSTDNQAKALSASSLLHLETRNERLARAFVAVDQQKKLSSLNLEAKVLKAFTDAKKGFGEISINNDVYYYISEYQHLGQQASQGEISGYELANSKLGFISQKLFKDPITLYECDRFQDLIKKPSEQERYTMNLRNKITVKELAELVNKLYQIFSENSCGD